MGGGVRVRLRFDDSCRDICKTVFYKPFWFLVNLDRQKTIENLALELSSRFTISSDVRVELTLDGCLLPHWETTAILRDNDLVTVAAHKDVASKRNGDEDDRRKAVPSESNKLHKKKRRAHEEREENVLALSVAASKVKRRRKKVETMGIVEEDMTTYSGADDVSVKKRRNGLKQDVCTEILNLSEFPYDQNSVQSSAALDSRSCHMRSSEDLTSRLQPAQAETDVVNGNEQTHSSSFIVGSVSSASAVEENECQFGEKSMVSSKVDEGNSQFDEVGMAVKDSTEKVKKKTRRTRRSRKNRKEKHAVLFDPELKSSFNIGSLETLETSSREAQRRTFQWQNTDLPWSKKTSATSLPQHIIFDDDNNLAESGPPPDEHNCVMADVTESLLNCDVAAVGGGSAETICEGLICDKEEVSSPSMGIVNYIPKRNHQAILRHDGQMPQLNGTRLDAGSIIEHVAGEGRASSRPMLTAKTSGVLSYDETPRQIHSVTDPSPFTNVQVFKRQRGTKFQSSRSAAEPVFTDKGNNFPAPTYTKCKATEDTLNLTTLETVKDYSVYELLLGPPRPGDVIAYKILQLSADYSPVLSSYKEAKVQKFVSATRLVELEPKNLQIPSQVKKSTGRFDLTIEDEHEILTNSVMQDDQLISISWDLLLEPRLLV